jgi:hypothetical protein
MTSHRHHYFLSVLRPAHAASAGMCEVVTMQAQCGPGQAPEQRHVNVCSANEALMLPADAL